MVRPNSHRPLSVTLNADEHAAVMEAARIRGITKTSDLLRAGLAALDIPVRPSADYGRALGTPGMTEYGFQPARVRHITSVRIADADADADEPFATLRLTLPKAVLDSITAFARARQFTPGQLAREGLRRLGAPIPSEVDLGFAEPEPVRRAA